MSVLVFAETSEGKFKKSAFEATSYGKKVADGLGTTLLALSINAEDPVLLQTYGASKIVNVSNTELKFNAKIFSDIVKQIAEKENATIIIFDSSVNSLYMAPLTAAALNAGYASNVTASPTSLQPFTVKRKAFSNKAFNFTQINTATKVISIAKVNLKLMVECWVDCQL